MECWSLFSYALLVSFEKITTKYHMGTLWNLPCLFPSYGSRLLQWKSFVILELSWAVITHCCLSCADFQGFVPLWDASDKLLESVLVCMLSEPNIFIPTVRAKVYNSHDIITFCRCRCSAIVKLHLMINSSDLSNNSACFSKFKFSSCLFLPCNAWASNCPWTVPTFFPRVFPGIPKSNMYYLRRVHLRPCFTQRWDFLSNWDFLSSSERGSVSLPIVILGYTRLWLGLKP